MDRYKETFERLEREKRIGFCPFAVLGDPNEKACLMRIKKYLEVSPDFLELGIPFSDPIADGPVIQAADERAIKAGVTPTKAIKMVAEIRKITKNVPIGILTYSNTVIRYGIENFYSDLKKAGADSVLIADVPLEEIKPFAKSAKKHHIHQIFIVSDYSDRRRLKEISKFASGFLYVVGVMGVTGVRNSLEKNMPKLIKRLKKTSNLPLMVGFGVSKREHIEMLQDIGADGAIVGSALVKTPYKELKSTLRELVAY